jgi:hypothetical protein
MGNRARPLRWLGSTNNKQNQPNNGATGRRPMKYPLEWAAAHLKKPAYFCILQIIAGLASADAAGVLLSRFQAVGHVAADPIGHRSGGEILNSVAVLARLSGDIEVISLIAPLAGAVIGTLIAIMLGANGILHSRDARVPRPLRTDLN